MVRKHPLPFNVSPKVKYKEAAWLVFLALWLCGFVAKDQSIQILNFIGAFLKLISVQLVGTILSNILDPKSHVGPRLAKPCQMLTLCFKSLNAMTPKELPLREVIITLF